VCVCERESERTARAQVVEPPVQRFRGGLACKAHRLLYPRGGGRGALAPPRQEREGGRGGERERRLQHKQWLREGGGDVKSARGGGGDRISLSRDTHTQSVCVYEGESVYVRECERGARAQVTEERFLLRPKME